MMPDDSLMLKNRKTQMCHGVLDITLFIKNDLFNVSGIKTGLTPVSVNGATLKHILHSVA